MEPTFLKMSRPAPRTENADRYRKMISDSVMFRIYENTLQVYWLQQEMEIQESTNSKIDYHSVTICDIVTHGVTMCVMVTHGVTICDMVTHGVK